MALFELTDGRLGEASPGRPAPEPTRTQALAALRTQLGQVLRRPLLPVAWMTVAGGQSLTALDPAGQVVTVEVLSVLDAATLVAALSRQAETAAMGRGSLAAVYPGGASAFREDWNEFREAMPARVEPGPRLIVLTTELAADVRVSAAFLGSSVEVHVVDVREVEDAGRHSVLVCVELLRADPLAASPTLLSFRVPRRVLTTSVDDAAAPARVSGRRRAAAPDAAPANDAPVSTVPVAVSAPDDATVPEGLPAPEHEPSAEAATGPVRDAEPREPARDSEPTEPTEPTEPVGEETGAHRLAAPPLGAQPTVPAEEAAAALAAVAGRLDAPVELRWRSLRRGIDHTAVLTADGVLTLADGRTFTDPSAAAAAAQRTPDVDGWRVWRLGERGAPLASLLG